MSAVENDFHIFSLISLMKKRAQINFSSNVENSYCKCNNNTIIANMKNVVSYPNVNHFILISTLLMCFFHEGSCKGL